MTPIIRAYALLKSFRQNLPSGPWISSEYVREYNQLVERLATTIGQDLQEFMIPADRITRRLSSVDYDGNREYTEESFCDEEFLKGRMDALLMCFEFASSPAEAPQLVGFDLK